MCRKLAQGDPAVKGRARLFQKLTPEVTSQSLPAQRSPCYGEVGGGVLEYSSEWGIRYQAPPESIVLYKAPRSL